jgi:hypothetical protein
MSENTKNEISKIIYQSNEFNRELLLERINEIENKQSTVPSWYNATNLTLNLIIILLLILIFLKLK